MITHVPGIQPFSRIFVLAEVATTSIRVNRRGNQFHIKALLTFSHASTFVLYRRVLRCSSTLINWTKRTSLANRILSLSSIGAMKMNRKFII